ncbi:hypothetical protein PGQ11_015149 [Apiospora arundinis]|uniref:Clr5 domain-containing protein n=1 Tax=Apiospora arundinis TaxID=335852 RepID=A0ABR2HLQ2_9PEZI
MEGHRRHEKDQIWESLRADIERMFIGERLGLNEIIAWLAKKDIHVTKNKLNYRLNKIWRLPTQSERSCQANQTVQHRNPSCRLDSSERCRAACFNSISNPRTSYDVHPMAQRLALVGLQYTATQD